MQKPDNITKNDWKILISIYKDKQDYLKEMLSKNYPIQYLIGHVSFCWLNFYVDENVLIPRFETEQLVEKSGKHINDLNLNNPTILDIGTGSGCIAITLARWIENSKVSAIDISSKALEVAKENAYFNNSTITFIEDDILKMKQIPYYDIIISNPPYVRYDEEVGIETKYEPEIALFAENDGLIFYENIINKCHKDTKLIAFEIGALQGENIMKLAKKRFPNALVFLEKDYSNRDRFIFIINKGI